MTGRVTDAATGQPVPNAQVVADGMGYDETDAQGRFSLTTTSGSRVVKVYFNRTADHLNGDTGPYVRTPNLRPAAQQVSVVANGTATVDFALQPGGIAEGTLRTPTGRAFPANSPLYVTGPDGPFKAALAQTGRFVIPGLATGTYVLYGELSEEKSTGNTNTLRTRIGSVTVTAGSTTARDFTFLHRYRATRITVEGTRKVGRTLQADLSWYVNPQVRTYRWLRDGKPIGGATSRSYKLKSKDAGHRISVRTVGSGTYAQTITVTSGRTGKIKR